MDPNALWDNLLINMTVLYEMRNDSEYVGIGCDESEEDIQEVIACSLEDLAEWIRKGGAVPMLFDK